MVSTLTNQTFSTTYKDDFSDSAGFHKILFNSGKALQARELNQLQTILQEQITRFGNNIFREGGVVKPGGVNLNSRYEFVKLATYKQCCLFPTSCSCTYIHVYISNTCNYSSVQWLMSWSSCSSNSRLWRSTLSGWTASSRRESARFVHMTSPPRYHHIVTSYTLCIYSSLLDY